MKASSRFILFLTFFILVVSCNETETPVEEGPTIILGAFADEVLLLKDQIKELEINELEGIRFYKGKLQGKNVVLLYTGMGKVNAAMVSSLFIHHFKPSRLIFSGIAGGLNPNLHPGDIVIAEQCVQHDLNTVLVDTMISFSVRSPASDEIIPLFLQTDSLLLDLSRRVAENIDLPPEIIGGDTVAPQIIFGTIATGDSFIASSGKSEEIRKRFGADAVEMEGAAVAQVCWEMDVPFLLIRSISDAANEYAEEDVTLFYKLAARNSSNLVLEVLSALEN